MRAGRVTLAVVALWGAAACEPTSASPTSAPADVERPRPTEREPQIRQQDTTDTTTPPAPTETIGLRPSADPVLVSGCVELVMFKAYTGDPNGQQLWSSVGESEAGLRTFCTDLAIDSPEMARAATTEMNDINRFLDAVAAPAAPAPAPPPAPPVAPAPPAPASGTACDPNYSGCVPIASDVDCAGGSGNGPAYTSGPVQVLGADVYGLDRDGDGWGCD